MPWNMTDYPNSMKNLKPLERKKAIDIANALLANGYPDDRAIPIAMSQAEKWFAEASTSEKKAYRAEPNPKKSDQHETSGNPNLLNADVIVRHDGDFWTVASEGAERASDRFETKKEAIARGREIAINKKSRLKIYYKGGSFQNVLKLK